MKKYFRFNTVNKQEIFQKSTAISATVFGIVTFFSKNYTVVILLTLLIFFVSFFVEYQNQRNAGIIREIVDRRITGRNTQFVLKKTYGVYNIGHYVYIYYIDKAERYLFAIGQLYKDPLNEHIAPLYLNPVCFFDKNKKIITLGNEELLDIDYKKLYVSRWMIASDD